MRQRQIALLSSPLQIDPKLGKSAIAHISSKSHANGVLNPKAHLRKAVAEEQIINAPMIAYPLGLFDCCGVSDGAACAIVSANALANERRISLRRLAAIGVLATSVTAAIAISILIWQLKDQYISEQLSRSVYGPAIFLSVFGCVLAVAGGIVLMADYLGSERKKGTFAASAGRSRTSRSNAASIAAMPPFTSQEPRP